jgi:hypothetical protein
LRLRTLGDSLLELEKMAVKDLESGELTVIWDFLMGGGDSGRGILIGFGDSDLAGDLFLLEILAGGFLVKCVMEDWAFGGETKLRFLYMPGFELIQLTRDGLDRQSWFELFDSPRNSPYKGLDMKGCTCRSDFVSLWWVIF